MRERWLCYVHRVVCSSPFVEPEPSGVVHSSLQKPNCFFDPEMTHGRQCEEIDGVREGSLRSAGCLSTMASGELVQKLTAVGCGGSGVGVGAGVVKLVLVYVLSVFLVLLVL